MAIGQGFLPADEKWGTKQGQVYSINPPPASSHIVLRKGIQGRPRFSIENVEGLFPFDV